MTDTVGIIGAGRLGQAMARTAVRAGRRVVLANSRGPESLASVISELGTSVSAGSVEQAAAARISSCRAVGQCPGAVAGIDWHGRVVIDATQRLGCRRPERENLERARCRSRRRGTCRQGRQHTRRRSARFGTRVRRAVSACSSSQGTTTTRSETSWRCSRTPDSPQSTSATSPPVARCSRSTTRSRASTSFDSELWPDERESTRRDASGASARGLASDERHPSSVRPDPRQDPARDYATAQPLVERCVVCRRPWADNAAPPSSRHDVRDQHRLRRPRSCRRNRRRSQEVIRARRRSGRRGLRRASPFGASRSGYRRRDQGATVRCPDDDAVHARTSSTHRGIGARSSASGVCSTGQTRCSRSSAAGSTARQARSTCSGTASTSPSPDSPAGRAAPIDADAVTREAYSQELISFGFWAGDDTFGDAAYYSYTAPEPAGLREQPLPVGEWIEYGAGSLAVLPYETVRRARDSRTTLLAFCQAAYEAEARLAGWDTTSFESSWCPTPRQRQQLQASAAADFGRPSR